MRCPPSLPLASAVAALALLGGGGASATHGPAVTPLNDLAGGAYLGFQGGLYEAGSNNVPFDHAVVGDARAAAVAPLDGSGLPAAGGRIVLLSIGMSNTTQEFCSANSALPCDSWTFMGQAGADASVNHTSLAIVNGAAGGQAATTWDSSADANYDRVRDTRLIPAGLSEQQVQVVWLKVANPGPSSPLPASTADAYALETSMGNIVRALKTRYPNLQLVFASSRIYAGYATTTLNPEPYAYESGFSVKWLVQAQVGQMRNGGIVVDPRAGDLNYGTVAPWVGWGPYPWADGLNPRSDGLAWVASDFGSDGTHPAQSGRQKVGTMLLDFFKTSPLTRCWFLGDVDGDGLSDPCDSGDSDADGLSDQSEHYCGSPPDDATKRPERLDLAGDDDGDAAVDEPLPVGSDVFDCDGDGWTGAQEQLVFSAGTTANDQDSCGSNGWPAELAGNNNALNIADLNSFLTPPRLDGSFNKFNHALDDDGDTVIDPAMARWNLQTPPHDAATLINIGDLNALLTGAVGAPARPPMFAGQPAFFASGGMCPWPP